MQKIVAMNNPSNDKDKRSNYQPLGKLYDDPREHGDANTQPADESAQAKEQSVNKKATNTKPNAAGSPTRGESSSEHAAEGHGNQ